jgi:hypothetical protein
MNKTLLLILFINLSMTKKWNIIIYIFKFVRKNLLSGQIF